MISNKQIVAIDLGSSHISAMAAEIQEDDSIKILSEESKASDDVKWGIVEQPSGAAFKISELQKLLQNSAKMFDISMVSVGVGAKSMKHNAVSVSRFIGKPNIVTEALLAEMLDECKRKSERNDRTIFDVIPLSYYVDDQRMDDPVDQKGYQILANYHVISGNAIIRAELERCFDRTGISLEYCPLTVEALSTVLLDEQELDAGCALINFGATTTTLAVYSEGALQYLSVVPLGAKNITKDIQELGVTEANAERLKCLKGVAMESFIDDPIYIQIPSTLDGNIPVKISTKFLATIIEARLEEIMQPIFEAIARFEFPLNAGIIITGGGSKLTNIIDFISLKTGIYTRFGDHSEWLADGTNEKYFDPSYSQLIGTIVLTNEYRKEHPIEITIVDTINGPKIKKRNIGEKIANGFFNFFGDENKFENKEVSK
jgi:cell division protein FtsA